jgi:hypothetical protein
MNSYIDYVKSALLHPVNFMVFGVAAVISLVTFNPLFIILGLGWEVAWVGGAPAVPAFRQSVDKKKQLDKAEDKQELDQKMLQTLPPAIQGRYQKLQAISASIPENFGKDSQASTIFLDQINTRVTDVMDRYLQMLKAHDSYQNHIKENPPLQLQENLASLDKEIGEADEKLAALKTRQRQILEKRYQKSLKAEQDCSLLGAQLDTLEELVKLLSTQALTMKKPQEISSQLDGIMSEIEVSESTMTELESSFEDLFDKELNKAEEQKRLKE